MTAFASVRSTLAALAKLVSPRERLVRRVLAGKRARSASADTYVEHPRVSLIVAALNSRVPVVPTLERLRATGADEIIVCEVNLTREFDNEWLRGLTGRNEFLIRSTNGGEFQAYNRAIGLAKGPVICIAPMGGLPLINMGVMKGAISMFGQHPRLAILGDVPMADRSDSTEASIESPIFCSREVLLTLNGFDAHAGRRDATALVDLCRRAGSLGWQFGHTGARVWQGPPDNAPALTDPAVLFL